MLSQENIIIVKAPKNSCGSQYVVQLELTGRKGTQFGITMYTHMNIVPQGEFHTRKNSFHLLTCQYQY